MGRFCYFDVSKLSGVCNFAFRSFSQNTPLLVLSLMGKKRGVYLLSELLTAIVFLIFLDVSNVSH